MGHSLVGKREICKYVRRSWTTVLDWVKTSGFPAAKIGGVWESDTSLVDDWKRTKIKPCQEVKNI